MCAASYLLLSSSCKRSLAAIESVPCFSHFAAASLTRYCRLSLKASFSRDSFSARFDTYLYTTENKTVKNSKSSSWVTRVTRGTNLCVFVCAPKYANGGRWMSGMTVCAHKCQAYARSHSSIDPSIHQSLSPSLTSSTHPLSSTLSPAHTNASQHPPCSGCRSRTAMRTPSTASRLALQQHCALPRRHDAQPRGTVFSQRRISMHAMHPWRGPLIAFLSPLPPSSS